MNTTVISDPECKRLFGPKGEGWRIGGNNFCARNSPGISACDEIDGEGDHGGGLIIQDEGAEPTLIGVYSWKLALCTAPTPNVFERVFLHLEFIEDAILRMRRTG